MNKLKLGILGMSDGNGHPYSWSAIFNGYNSSFMKDCPFPVIPEYLSKQIFPNDSIKEATVTHIWTQDAKLSEHIAKASNIENIVENYTDMIGKVDAILLARDDALHHYEMAKPFIEAGLPIYIDKPLALNLNEAKKIYSLEKYTGQIFTCSAISYAKEFMFDKNNFGEIKYIEATIDKDWEKYSIHIIEPVLRIIGETPKIKSSVVNSFNRIKTFLINFENDITVNFKTMDNCNVPIKITIYGTNLTKDFIFEDSFNSFKSALFEFIKIIKKERKNNSKEITLKAIEIIERGLEND